jgi:hypothetical protein
VDVVNKANRRPPTPEGTEIWEAVLNVDEKVPVPEPTGMDKRGPGILRVRAPKVDHGVATRFDRTAASERGFVTTSLQSARQLINDDLRSAGLRMGEVTPREEDNPHQFRSSSFLWLRLRYFEEMSAIYETILLEASEIFIPISGGLAV